MYLTVDGHRAYAYTGARAPAPGQPAIAFVHGAGCDHTVWLLQSRYLAHHGYNVYAFDLPAHGRSEGEPLGEIGAMADWVWRALDAAGEERAALVGHSMGSLVALEAAGRAPERAWLLVMVGTALPMAVSDELLGAARADRHEAFDMINVWGHALAAQMGGNESPGMWMTGSVVRLLERCPPGVLHRDLAACDAYASGLESARRVACPAHLVLGDEDVMSPPRRTLELREALGRVRVTELRGAGHMLMNERPNEVLDAILESLRAHAPTTSGSTA